MRKTHAYSLTTYPPSPIRVGSFVRIFALAGTPFYSLSRWQHILDVYDPHIQGVVAHISEERVDGRVALAIVNECAVNLVDIVTLHVPNLPAIVDDPNEHSRPTQAALDHTEHLLDVLAVTENPWVLAGEGRCDGMECRGSVYDGLDLRTVHWDAWDWEGDTDVEEKKRRQDEEELEKEAAGARPKKRARPRVCESLLH